MTRITPIFPCFILAIGLTTLTSTPAVAIGRGTPVENNAYPFVAKLVVGTLRSCSASLVHPQWLLTTASCLADAEGVVRSGPPAVGTLATIGRPNLALNGGHVLAIVEVAMRTDRNLALAKLAEPITDILPARLSTAVATSTESLRVAGYGRTTTEWIPDRMQSALLRAGPISTTTFALDGSGPADAVLCKGDAGGPAFRESALAELVAVHGTSAQDGCLGSSSAGSGALEVRVDDLLDWLRTTSGGGPSYPLVSSTDLTFTTGAAIPTPGPGAVVGRPAAVTLRPSPSDTEVAGYFVGLASGAATSPNLWFDAGSDGSAVVPIVPSAADEPQYLTVQAKSRSGALGLVAAYAFNASASAVTTSVANDLTGDGRSDLVYLRNIEGHATIWAALSKYDGSGLFEPRQLYDGGAGSASQVVSLVDGDFDGDRRSDVALLESPSTGRMLLSILGSNGNALAAPIRVWDSADYLAPGASSDWNPATVQLASADVTGDGKADLVLGRPTADGVLSIDDAARDVVGSWNVVVAASTSATAGSFTLAPSSAWHTELPGSSTWGRSKLLAGDVTGDGKADLVRVEDNGSAQLKVWVQASTGTGFGAAQNWFDSGRDTWDLDKTSILIGNFAGSAAADLAVINEESARARITPLISNGSRFDAGTPWDSATLDTFDRARSRFLTGDFGGSPTLDVAALYDQGYGRSKLRVMASTGNTFSAPATRWDSGAERLPWPELVVGDARTSANLARDATFSASSSAPDSWGWSLRYVNDGNRDSLRTAGWSSWSNVNAPHNEWLDVTFPSQRWFDRVDLYPRKDNGAYDGDSFPPSFTIGVWNGASWVNLVNRPQYSNPGGTLASFSFIPQFTNRIRIEGSNLGVMQFAEVEVYQTRPKLPEPNLLLGATATASSSAPESWGWALRWVNDGSRAMPGWSSWSNVDADHSEWLEFALPSPRYMNRVDLYARSDGQYTGDNFPANFTIETWNGSAWEQVVYRSAYPHPTSEVQSFAFQWAKKTSRVRIVGTGLRTMAFREVEAYLSH